MGSASRPPGQRGHDDPLQDRREAGVQRRDGRHESGVGPALAHDNIQPLAEYSVAHRNEDKTDNERNTSLRLPLSGEQHGAARTEDADEHVASRTMADGESDPAPGSILPDGIKRQMRNFPDWIQNRQDCNEAHRVWDGPHAGFNHC